MDTIDNSNLVLNKKGWITVDLVGSNQECSIETSKEKDESGGKHLGKLEKRKILEGLWEKFAATTTGHGFARMVDKNEPLKLRIFWVVAVIFLTIGLFTSVFIISYDSLVLKGLRREFIVQHNSSLNLPDIHICDTSLFNVTILKGIVYFILN